MSAIIIKQEAVVAVLKRGACRNCNDTWAGREKPTIIRLGVSGLGVELCPECALGLSWITAEDYETIIRELPPQAVYPPL